MTWIRLLPGTGRLRTLRVACKEMRLWYVPFSRQGQEMVNLLTGVIYNSAVFRGLGH
jgi:hypothetical protein